MIGIGAKIIILYGLLKVLSISESPGLCAGLYGLVSLPFLLFYEDVAWYFLALGWVVSVGLSFGWFYLLYRYAGSNLYILILIGGLLIGII